MSINSKIKGKNYELEVRKDLKKLGYSNVKRSVQYCGNNTDSNNADLIGLNGIHIECKHYNNIGFKYECLEQAIRDSKIQLIFLLYFIELITTKQLSLCFYKIGVNYIMNIIRTYIKMNYRLHMIRQTLLSIFFNRNSIPLIYCPPVAPLPS